MRFWVFGYLSLPFFAECTAEFIIWSISHEFVHNISCIDIYNEVLDLAHHTIPVLDRLLQKQAHHFILLHVFFQNLDYFDNLYILYISYLTRDHILWLDESTIV